MSQRRAGAGRCSKMENDQGVMPLAPRPGGRPFEPEECLCGSRLQVPTRGRGTMIRVFFPQSVRLPEAPGGCAES